MIWDDSLLDMNVFVHVVAAGSLTAAGREMGMSLAVVSKRLARLEERLGVRLINRTSRQLSLTEEGLEFHLRSVRLLADYQDARNAISGRKQVANGLLRVTASAAFARRQIAPRLARLHQLYPQLRVQVVVTDTVVDLVQSGIDLAIRQAVLPDSSLMMRVLAPNRRVVCAAPGYLADHGRPEIPADLAHHDCIVFGDPPMNTWRFECRHAEGEPVAVKVSGTVQSNDGEVAHTAALAGAGIVVKSIWDVAGDLDAGRLVELLPRYRVPASPIQAVYPSGHHLAARVGVFLDFMAEELRGAYIWGDGP